MSIGWEGGNLSAIQISEMCRLQWTVSSDASEGEDPNGEEVRCCLRSTLL